MGEYIIRYFDNKHYCEFRVDADDFYTACSRAYDELDAIYRFLEEQPEILSIVKLELK